MNPKELYYTKDHEWAKIEGGRVRVGLTHYAQEQLGDIVFVDLPAVGKEFKKGEALLVVESVKAASDVYAPLSGKVVEVNETLASKPEAVNQDPYGEGWIAILEVRDSSELNSLLSAQEYEKLISTL